MDGSMDATQRSAPSLFSSSNILQCAAVAVLGACQLVHRS